MIDTPEILSVGDDEIVLGYPAILGPLEVEPAIGEHASTQVSGPPEIIEPARVMRHSGLTPDTTYNFDGVTLRTLARPEGELLVTLATVTDLHFGETVTGILGSVNTSPRFHRGEGALSHPVLMNSMAVKSIADHETRIGREFDFIVAKGDLTNRGSREEFDQFTGHYVSRFGSRLGYIRGNHDAKAASVVPGISVDSLELPGVTLCLVDTTITDVDSGQVSPRQVSQIQEVVRDRDHLVFIFGHHHPFSPDSTRVDPNYFGLDPDSSRRLVDLIQDNRNVVGYFCGHTHRNRVRYFSATGPVPYVETACVKDFPGSWTEYRIFEGGTLQISRRIGDPEALAWSEANRMIYAGLYPGYALGQPTDRSINIDYR